MDDVATTGATLLEAAKNLKRNGAAKVFCLTVARDQPFQQNTTIIHIIVVYFAFI